MATNLMYKSADMPCIVVFCCIYVSQAQFGLTSQTLILAMTEKQPPVMQSVNYHAPKVDDFGVLERSVYQSKTGHMQFTLVSSCNISEHVVCSFLIGDRSIEKLGRSFLTKNMAIAFFL
jgi:hypothetical protein